MTGVILAGGENRRIPYIKGLLRVGGVAIIERNLHIFKRVFDKVCISTNQPEFYFSFGVPLIGDIIKERGPMTGIFSVLVATGADSIFVIACDMPFVKEGLVRYMKDRYEVLLSSGICFDVIIPRFKGMIEPLAGIYTSRITERLEESLMTGRKGLYAFLEKVNTVYIEEEEIGMTDPEGLSFTNINTLEDYGRIKGGMRCSV